MTRKAITRIFFAAIVCITLWSCDKTQMNSARIMGAWKVVKMEWLYPEITTPEPYNSNVCAKIEFQDEGQVLYTLKDSDDAPSSFAGIGDWSVRGDNLTLGLPFTTTNIFSGKYVIVSINKKELRLSYMGRDEGPLIVFLKKV